jgi:hypothetical protein
MLKPIYVVVWTLCAFFGFWQRRSERSYLLKEMRVISLRQHSLSGAGQSDRALKVTPMQIIYCGIYLTH